MKRSVVLALVIAVGTTLWIASSFFFDPEASAPEVQKPPASISHLDKAPSVRVKEQSAKPHAQMIILRGDTEPRRAVDLKSETFGTVEKILASEGSLVRQNQELAHLDEAERDAQLRQAKALLKQRTIEYEASRKLATKGYRSETERAAAEASLEAAQATVEAAEIELGHAIIKAPFAGILERHIMEEGDFADRGDPLLRLVELSPLRVVAFANENEILELRLGMRGKAQLTNGRSIPGQIAYLAQEAEPTTRTFRVELEIDNRDFSVPAGVTADIVITLPSTPAHKISPAVLTLDKSGRLGVKIVDKDDHAKFVPVRVVDDEIDGIWVEGLPYKTRIITVGQEFVSDGQEVRPLTEEDVKGAKEPEEEGPSS